MHVPVAAALPFSTARVARTNLAYSAKALYNVAPFRIHKQVILDTPQDFIRGGTSQALQTLREGLGFYEYHSVDYTTLWHNMAIR